MWKLQKSAQELFLKNMLPDRWVWKLLGVHSKSEQMSFEKVWTVQVRSSEDDWIMWKRLTFKITHQTCFWTMNMYVCSCKVIWEYAKSLEYGILSMEYAKKVKFLNPKSDIFLALNMYLCSSTEYGWRFNFFVTSSLSRIIFKSKLLQSIRML